ncbi:stage II sporulation protein M [Tissierellaceae bacterium HCP3S3_D8]
MLYRQIFHSLKKHFQAYFIFYFILALVFIVGIISGPIVTKKVGYNTRMVFLKLSHPYFKDLYVGEYTNFSVLKTSIINNIFLMMIIVMLGLVNLGVFLIPILIILKGTFIGFTVAFLVDNFGVRGFLSSLIGVYPQNIFIIGGLIGIGAVAMSMSYNIKMTFINRPFLRRNINLNEYLLITGIFAFIVITGSLIEGVISPKILRLTIERFF